MTQRASSRNARRRAHRRTNFRRTTAPENPRTRLLVVLIFFCMVGAGFVAQLVDRQAVRPEQFRTIGEDQRTSTRKLAAYRGQIVDRNGFVLASSTPTHETVADPTMIVDPEASAGLLSPVLGIDAGILEDQLNTGSEGVRYALLAKTVSDEAADELSALAEDDRSREAMKGIFVRPAEDRIYPGGRLATPIVGRVDPDEVGIFGVEKLFDEVMTGQPGSEQFERGRFGSISVGDWKVDPASEGYDIVLTLDHRIQFVTEQALLEHCAETRADGATAVIAEPDTGEIIAMATVVRNDDGTCEVPRYNAALIDTFEPGSVLKTITMAAAAEELGYTGDSVVQVPSQVSIGGKTFVDRPRHASAPYPVSQILSNSMNVGTIEVARKLGPARVHQYLSRFGFGQASGLDFEGEAVGTVRTPSEWQGSDSGSIPIGQGITVNATQLVGAYSAIANGGKYQPPTVVKAIESPVGERHEVKPVDGWPVVNQASADVVTDLLIGVVAEGTGKSASIPGYTVAGKTGTAWKVFDDGSGKHSYGSDNNRRYVVTFAGFVPAKNPQLSMVVVVDEPKTDTTASAVAAPVFAEIGQYALRIRGVAPDRAVHEDGGLIRGTPAGEATDEMAESELEFTGANEEAISVVSDQP